MALIYAAPQRSNAQRLVNRPVNRQISETPCYRSGQYRSSRPGPSRPGRAPVRYYGTGVAMSTAPHGRRSVTVATTVGLALLAGVITLWLGLMANFGSASTGNRPDRRPTFPPPSPWCGWSPGSPCRTLAARVAPGAPTRDVVERIRDLNALDTNTVAAGQTLIAPIG